VAVAVQPMPVLELQLMSVQRVATVQVEPVGLQVVALQVVQAPAVLVVAAQAVVLARALPQAVLVVQELTLRLVQAVGAAGAVRVATQVLELSAHFWVVPVGTMAVAVAVLVAAVLRQIPLLLVMVLTASSL
jgi:hypothetical protein